MSILLLGYWNDGGDLIVYRSLTVSTDDQATIDKHVNGQTRPSPWAATFEVDTHEAAVQEAYETYVQADKDDRLFDTAHGFVPQISRPHHSRQEN